MFEFAIIFGLLMLLLTFGLFIVACGSFVLKLVNK